MADRRYNTVAWRRVRGAVLNRDAHICRLQGARCRGRADTVHHLVPSSQAPHLFFDTTNLVAACSSCNYGDGAKVKAANGRYRIATLLRTIEEQDQRIVELLERLQQYEQPQAAPDRRRARPAIY